MNLGQETGLRPALRVLRHYRERRRYSQLTFPNGERAVVLVAGMPEPSVELVRLVLGGVVPWQTVWEHNPTKAGGYSNYIHTLKTMFAVKPGGSEEPLQWIREALLPCRSIDEARMLLLQRERMANGSTGESDESFTIFPPQTGTVGNGASRKHEPESPAPDNGSAEEARAPSTIPNRYPIKESAQGRTISCVEAPTLTVRADKSFAVAAKQAHKSPAGTIFLDGAAKSEPFVDFEKDIYNLDHPQGCLRSLSSCEQSVLLIRKLGDLRKRDWVIYVNDGDLDTVLAVWVLLNHLRLNESPKLRTRVMPMLRLEGVIDAHGPDMQDLAALPPELLQPTAAMLKQLRQQEAVFKSFGRWSDIDLVDYLADRLGAIDELVYSPDTFEQLHPIEELARAEITHGSLAVACRSEAEINAVERQLRKIYGERLAVLILETAPSAYALRSVSQSVPESLERAYDRLNLLDPVVKSDSQNRWSGSAEVGASPRKTGTGLTAAQIIAAVRDAFRPPSIADVAAELLRAIFVAGAALSPALALIVAVIGLRGRGSLHGQAALLLPFVLTITAGILYGLKARRVSGTYGWRWPEGFGWMITFPAALIGALAGGVWTPETIGYRLASPDAGGLFAFSALLLPVAGELLFRGVVFGNLAARLPLQRSGGSCGSWPTLISAVVYAAASVLLLLSFTGGAVQMGKLSVTAIAALVVGVASGKARESSGSVFPSLLLHSAGAVTLMLTGGPVL